MGTDKHDVLRGTERRDVITGLDGADVIRGRGGDDLICAGDGVFYGEYEWEVVYGGEGDDTIAGGDGYEELQGGPGDDVLRPTAGGGSARGGPGNDVHWGGPHGDILGGTLLDYTGFQFGRDIHWSGSIQSYGDPGIDRIVGNGGHDALVVGEGDEVMDGGDGMDEVTFFSKTASRYSADLVTNVAVGDQGQDVLVGIEKLAAFMPGDFVLRGDDGPNQLAGAPLPAGSGEFHGGGGDDLLVPWRPADNGGVGIGPVDIYGGDGDDRHDYSFATCDGDDAPAIEGGAGDDYLMTNCGGVPVGGDGDDFLFGPPGGFGEETLDGGNGFDIAAWPYSGRGSHLEADLLERVARIVDDSGEQSHPIHLVGIEGIEGASEAADVIRGDDGPNLLRGSSDYEYVVHENEDGGDTIDGRGGDDDIFGDEGNDVLDGGDGVDTVDGAEGRDTCLNAEIVDECESTSTLPRLLRLL